jgi:hypothetical protein
LQETENIAVAPPSEPATEASAPAGLMRAKRAWRFRVLMYLLVVGGGIIISIFWVNSRSERVREPSDITAYAARADATVRDAPTAQGSQKLGTLDRGEEVEGAWLPENAAGQRWFKIGSGRFAGDYVWARNLASSPPPTLSAFLDTRKMALSEISVVSKPDSGATVLDTIGARQTVYIVGLVGDGWYEIRLKRGGVGYAQASNFN